MKKHVDAVVVLWMLWTAYLHQIQRGCGHMMRFVLVMRIIPSASGVSQPLAAWGVPAEVPPIHIGATLPTESAGLPTPSVRELCTCISW